MSRQTVTFAMTNLKSCSSMWRSVWDLSLITGATPLEVNHRSQHSGLLHTLGLSTQNAPWIMCTNMGILIKLSLSITESSVEIVLPSLGSEPPSSPLVVTVGAWNFWTSLRSLCHLHRRRGHHTTTLWFLDLNKRQPVFFPVQTQLFQCLFRFYNIIL